LQAEDNVNFLHKKRSVFGRGFFRHKSRKRSGRKREEFTAYFVVTSVLFSVAPEFRVHALF
jgi:hypothetical protein